MSLQPLPLRHVHEDILHPPAASPARITTGAVVAIVRDSSSPRARAAAAT
ncbi:hypothetical protein [Nannocystis punicea]|uniref:Uncharacterized protein n=1 Tax=Nannocystis punicea TaxID=2995304 RepID=A0ABY7H822_9BACT|nr:hypothetical protein [Nannocystis poenicansa]WAS95412.1 hypothetical protein O0S08_04565 [Nannocystis poenicansa]